MFEGSPLLLLHHRGAKSGRSYVNPLVYRPDGDRYVVFASKAGAPTNPGWYHNLVAYPEVKLEVLGETIPARARVAEGEEHDRLYDAQAQMMPAFADYQKRTTRKIPVFILEPVRST